MNKVLFPTARLTEFYRVLDFMEPTVEFEETDSPFFITPFNRFES